MVPVKLWEQLTADHGEHVQVGSWFLFQDGAQLNVQSLQYVESPLPSQPEHYPTIKKYLQTRLDLAQREFDLTKQDMTFVAAQCADQGWDLPHDFAEAQEQLAALKAIVDERRAAFDRHTAPERRANAQMQVHQDEEEVRRYRKQEAAREALEALQRL
ncbi:hypothetical protein Pan44_43310 [Caulifigura coniformis]|uniref:Uncharacterized protein n=1 Tax=Caulifigura coniformis TaxID=2527983 RepID=A0A517SJH8_9PLAN|nr:hypothetical protein [Caulifigura coniformis]QDT56278.1 hypothetical protein Pan44_43310 [Caulifigura coniformis]